MKVSAEMISERNKIISSFTTPMEYTGLLATDITDHESQIEKIYKNMIHEKTVIDDCRRRFEQMFRWN